MGYIQIVRGDYYARMAMSSQTRGIPLEDYARGGILDRKMRSLTGSYRSERVFVFPDAIDDRDAVVSGLSEILGADPGKISAMLSGGPAGLPFDISGEQSRLIREKSWRGVVVAPYTHRYGPGALASHVVGTLGRVRDTSEQRNLSNSSGKRYLLNDWTGREGLELFYEKELKGEYPSGFAGLLTDAKGRCVPGFPVFVDTATADRARSDVVTTIDADIQETVERVMDRRVEKGCVVVMDTKTGDILAMASRPSFSTDPALAGSLSDPDSECYVNQAISLFQPGSVFKVAVAAAALSEGVVKPGSLFYCGGAGEKPVRCWKDEGHGYITFEEAFSQSCNPVFVKVARELGAQRLINYARAMGLDNQEIAGWPVSPDRRQDLGLIAGKYNLENSSVGQGPVLATPLQITAMTNTIAAGGIYLQPRLVMKVLPSGGTPRKIESAAPVRVISPEVARQVREMMVLTTREGLGRNAWVAGGGSAGKTGSAQLGGGSDVVNAWFSGFAPINSPRYTITVMVRDGDSGAGTAAPVFREIMDKILKLP
ncbi:MAG: peptidoglycan D,D-transpeptidase FtsI family protein [Bacillota bacterium]